MKRNTFGALYDFTICTSWAWVIKKTWPLSIYGFNMPSEHTYSSFCFFFISLCLIYMIRLILQKTPAEYIDTLSPLLTLKGIKRIQPPASTRRQAIHIRPSKPDGKVNIDHLNNLLKNLFDKSEWLHNLWIWVVKKTAKLTAKQYNYRNMPT